MDKLIILHLSNGQEMIVGACDVERLVDSGMFDYRVKVIRVEEL